MKWFVLRGLVLVAAVRVSALVRRLPLDRLIDRLRRVATLPEDLRRPEEFQQIVNRWYAWLPPRGMRSCLKRAYLMIDLLSRCGLHPTFHLGIQPTDRGQDGHAWLTVDGRDELGGSPEACEETFVA